MRLRLEAWSGTAIRAPAAAPLHRVPHGEPGAEGAGTTLLQRGRSRIPRPPLTPGPALCPPPSALCPRPSKSLRGGKQEKKRGRRHTALGPHQQRGPFHKGSDRLGSPGKAFGKSPWAHLGSQRNDLPVVPVNPLGSSLYAP